MNWLAHLRLAPDEPLVRLGNLCGDFVRGIDLSSLHPSIRLGVTQHRAIDRFVDAHPIAGRARARLQPPFRRFGGVLVDVFFDHFLARDWERLGAGAPLRDWLAGVHADLRTHAALLPPALQQVAPRFSADGWLEGYGSVAGIERVLGLMARRLARENPLAAGATVLAAHYDAFGADFAELWPALVASMVN